MCAQRRFFGAVIIWCIFSFVSLWFSKEIFVEYFDLKTEIIFSPYATSLLMVPVVLLFPCVYWFMSVRYGEELAIQKCKNVNKVFLGLVGIFIVSSVIFSFAYTSALQSKGYVKCPGRPDGCRGWTLSMCYLHRYVGSVIINKMFLPSGTSSAQFYLDNTIHSAIIEQK